MNILYEQINNKKIATVQSDSIILYNVEDAVDLLGNSSYNGATAIIIREENVCAEFFDLSTRIAGEILQKFSNYNMKFAIIGDFQKYKSKSLRDFIYESNKAGNIVFVSCLEEAMKMLRI